MRTVLPLGARAGFCGRFGGCRAWCIALPLRCRSGKYADSGGNGDDGGGNEFIVACERIEDKDGLGVRNDFDDGGFGA